MESSGVRFEALLAGLIASTQGLGSGGGWAKCAVADARKAFRHLDDDEAGLRELRLVAFEMAMKRTLDPYHPGDPVPRDFNRHASTHAVGAVQYGKFNSLTAVMLAVTLLREIAAALEIIDSIEGQERSDGAE